MVKKPDDFVNKFNGEKDDVIRIKALKARIKSVWLTE